MPLEPLPPPSPCENPPPSGFPPPLPVKHVCSAMSPCPICLSDIGKCYHTLPKGSLKLHYVPPSILKFILDYFHSHPFYWLWTTKAGPNAWKSLHVPHIPTHCTRMAHKAVCWTVDLFHSCKAHLSPASLDSQGHFPTPLLWIYHKNMLLHFCCQTACPLGPSSSGPPLEPPCRQPPLLPPQLPRPQLLYHLCLGHPIPLHLHVLPWR